MNIVIIWCFNWFCQTDENKKDCNTLLHSVLCWLEVSRTANYCVANEFESWQSSFIDKMLGKQDCIIMLKVHVSKGKLPRNNNIMCFPNMPCYITAEQSIASFDGSRSSLRRAMHFTSDITQYGLYNNKKKEWKACTGAAWWHKTNTMPKMSTKNIVMEGCSIFAFWNEILSTN